MMKVFKVTDDSFEEYITAPLVTGDTGAYKIVLETGEDLTGCSVRITARRADNTVLEDVGTTCGSSAEYIIKSGIYSVEGDLEIRMIIGSADGRCLTDKAIVFRVLKSHISGSMETAADNGTSAAELSLTHIRNFKNPHNVTKEQVGLGNVNNTSDINKPVSNAVRTELNSLESKIDAQKHGNMAVLDDLSDSNGKLCYKGKVPGGGLSFSKVTIEVDVEYNLSNIGLGVWRIYSITPGKWEDTDVTARVSADFSQKNDEFDAFMYLNIEVNNREISLSLHNSKPTLQHVVLRGRDFDGAIRHTYYIDVYDYKGIVHVHNNASVLDKLSDNSGKLAYNGSEVGGDAGSAADSNVYDATFSENLFTVTLDYNPDSLVGMRITFRTKEDLSTVNRNAYISIVNKDGDTIISNKAIEYFYYADFGIGVTSLKCKHIEQYVPVSAVWNGSRMIAEYPMMGYIEMSVNNARKYFYGNNSIKIGFFAPTTGGTTGQYLVSNGNAEPQWKDLEKKHGAVYVATEGNYDPSGITPDFIVPKNCGDCYDILKAAVTETARRGVNKVVLLKGVYTVLNSDCESDSGIYSEENIEIEGKGAYLNLSMYSKIQSEKDIILRNLTLEISTYKAFEKDVALNGVHAYGNIIVENCVVYMKNPWNPHYPKRFYAHKDIYFTNTYLYVESADDEEAMSEGCDSFITVYKDRTVSIKNCHIDVLVYSSWERNFDFYLFGERTGNAAPEKVNIDGSSIVLQGAQNGGYRTNINLSLQAISMTNCNILLKNNSSINSESFGDGSQSISNNVIRIAKDNSWVKIRSAAVTGNTFIDEGAEDSSSDDFCLKFDGNCTVSGNKFITQNRGCIYANDISSITGNVSKYSLSSVMTAAPGSVVANNATAPDMTY